MDIKTVPVNLLWQFLCVIKKHSEMDETFVRLVRHSLKMIEVFFLTLYVCELFCLSVIPVKHRYTVIIQAFNSYRDMKSKL